MRIHTALVALALTAVAVWGTGATDEGIKIGVVDIEQALASSDDGKRAIEEIQRKRSSAQGTVEPMVDRYKSLEEDIKSKRSVLSDEALNEKVLDLAKQRAEVEAKLKQVDADLQVDSERIVGPLRKKLVEVVQGVGKDQGYTMIFARGAGGMIYNREAIDITDLVVQKLNDRG
jgi:Skp family chaperone for outer membrane proteins